MNEIDRTAEQSPSESSMLCLASFFLRVFILLCRTYRATGVTLTGGGLSCAHFGVFDFGICSVVPHLVSMGVDSMSERSSFPRTCLGEYDILIGLMVSCRITVEIFTIASLS
jgi:hypothetical protein